jgi:drug/metabolite transporter (DMT)-like permease
VAGEKIVNKTRITGASILLTTAIIWGIAFVAQSEGTRFMGPFSFNSIRFMLGGVFLIPVIKIKDTLRKSKSKEKTEKDWDKENTSFLLSEKSNKRALIIGGLSCGIILAIANSFQQFGIMSTSVGKSGFITTLYIILVPIIGIFLKKKPPVIVWISAFLAMIGLYLLCINENSALNRGDIYLMICAVLFSCHILVIDYFSPKVDGIKLSCFQFFVSGFMCMIMSLIFETVTWAQVMDCMVPILYTGIMSCGVAYTCQIVGQKYMEPAVASLILSLESVVSVLAGWLILGQVLSVKEMVGCGIVFVAVILAQLPHNAEEKKEEREMVLTDGELSA